jgi:hypothetical protein
MVGEAGMIRLLEKRFSARVSVADAWAHLEKIEKWPTWAKHIRRAELSPPGTLVPESRGAIWLTNGVRSTFRMEELNPGVGWKWVGPFLWIKVHYDHQFRSRGPGETEVTFILDAEGFGVSVFGRLFAAVYRRNLERAVPNLVRELEGRGGAPRE